MNSKSIILWLNSQYYSSINNDGNKVKEISFDIPQITLFKETILKVSSYIHQSNSVKQMIIRLKNLLYNNFDSYPLNYPILFVANTNIESQLDNNQYSLSLLPQTINNITIMLDDQFLTNFVGVNADIGEAVVNIDNYSDVFRNNVIISPAVWYKFDTSNNLGLDAMGNHNLTNNANSVSYNSSIRVSGSGSAFFNGSNNTYLAKTSGFYDLDNKDFSISFWSYNTLTTQTNNRWFFNIGNALISGVNYQIGLYRTSTGSLTIYGVLDNLTYTTTERYLNTWLFITITYQNSNKLLTLYLNGVAVASRTNTYNYQMNKEIKIGSIATGVLAFQGYIEDFRIYNTLLTQTEINKLFNKINEIYIPPKFVVALTIEDADMEVYDSANLYKLK